MNKAANDALLTLLIEGAEQGDTECLEALKEHFPQLGGVFDYIIQQEEPSYDPWEDEA